MRYFPFLFLPFLLLSCNKDNTDDSNKPSDLKYIELFKAQSPFYDSIPATATVDPNSADMIQGLQQEANQGFLIAVKEWTVPVYYADANTALHEVKLTAAWSPESRLVNVPIPEYANPDPSNDGHMVVIDEANGCVYDFWQARYTNGGWKAGWANAIPMNSDGIYPQGLSARGSGFSLLQGLIWPQELEDGAIEHALIFSFDLTRAGGPVAPATESDGTSSGTNTIPEGALLQLNPNLDLNTLSLNSYEMTIAKAMQNYGMYCADDGGGVSLYAIHPGSAKNNPYASLWGDETYIDLNKIPIDQFQVLELPPQNNTTATLVTNSCADFQ